MMRPLAFTSTFIQHNSPSHARSVSHWNHAVRACANPARARLVTLLQSVPRDTARDSSDARAVEQAVQGLLESSSESSKNVTTGWERSVEGRWKLLYSSEGPLLSIAQNGLFPFGKAGRIYQNFGEGGRVENVIEFVGYGGEDSAWPAVVSVQATYVPRIGEQGFDFEFEKTGISYGRAAFERITGRKAERKGISLDFLLNFAFGKGFVKVLWVDHAIRIDESLLQGKTVKNIYAYDGPVNKCNIYASP